MVTKKNVQGAVYRRKLFLMPFLRITYFRFFTDDMVGQWIPGKIPGEFNWRGMDFDPMEKYRSIGEEVVFY